MKTLSIILPFLYAPAIAFSQINPAFLPNNQQILCGETEVYFVCTSPANPDYIKWDFGDGTILLGSVNPSHIYSTPGTYTVRIFVEKADKRDSAVKHDLVVVHPKPYAQFREETLLSSSPLTRKYVDQSSHYADSMVKYKWNINETFYDGGTVFYATFPDTGYYRVGLTVENNKGCSSSTEQTVHVTQRVNETGIKDITSVQARFAYPNPANHTLHLELPAAGGKITLTDMHGRQRAIKEINTDRIDISALEDGIYLISYTGKDFLYVQRFLKMN